MKLLSDVLDNQGENNESVMNQRQNIITVDQEILGGTPVFRGTRVAIKTLFDYLEYSSLEDFLEGYPTVKREEAEAVIELAADLLYELSAQ